jgi:hypothetical protein
MGQNMAQCPKKGHFTTITNKTESKGKNVGERGNTIRRMWGKGKKSKRN